MQIRQAACLIVAVALVVALWGCGAATQTTRTASNARGDQRPTIGGGYGGAAQAKASAKATATAAEYFGWKALKLTNGLVTVVVAPEAGGRIIEYKLGAHPFLWVNEAEQGKLYDAPKSEAERKWHNYGGSVVWPAPQKQWGGPPDPLGSRLDNGRWTGKIVSASGATASVEVTSPEDAGVTGLEITRTISLGTGSTRVSIKDTFRNVGKREVTWSIWTVTQVPGALKPGDKFSPEAKIYVPLNDDSKHKGGFFYASGEDTGQFRTIAGGKILETSYGGKVGKIGADSDAGWIAYVDDVNNATFVKTFKVTKGAQYPDNHSTVEVVTATAGSGYLEMEVLSPLKTLAPGQAYSFEQEWAAGSTGGPITKVTDAAAIKTHPTAARKGNEVIVSGEIAVFAPGKLTVELLDKDGKQVGTSKPIAVSPSKPCTLNIPVAVTDEAITAMVVLTDDGGDRVGNIAQVPLVAKVAKK